MASIPGLPADVYFGDTDTPLPDWRKVLTEEDSDDDTPSPEERKAVAGMLGFDPFEEDLEESLSAVDSSSMSSIQVQGGRRRNVPEARKEHRYATTQIDLPAGLARAVCALSDLIDEADLAEDGREDQPHVTCLYGLHGDDAGKVRQLVASFGPVRIRLGGLSVFPARETGSADVLKLDVASGDLHRLHALLADHCEHTDTHPVYQPHLTLAYLKPGMAEKYGSHSGLEGVEFTARELVFSDRSGKRTRLPLDRERPIPESHNSFPRNDLRNLQNLRNTPSEGTAVDFVDSVDGSEEEEDSSWRLDLAIRSGQEFLSGEEDDPRLALLALDGLSEKQREQVRAALGLDSSGDGNPRGLALLALLDAGRDESGWMLDPEETLSSCQMAVTVPADVIEGCIPNKVGRGWHDDQTGHRCSPTSKEHGEQHAIAHQEYSSLDQQVLDTHNEALRVQGLLNRAAKLHDELKRQVRKAGKNVPADLAGKFQAAKDALGKVREQLTLTQKKREALRKQMQAAAKTAQKHEKNRDKATEKEKVKAEKEAARQEAARKKAAARKPARKAPTRKKEEAKATTAPAEAPSPQGKLAAALAAHPEFSRSGLVSLADLQGTTGMSLPDLHAAVQDLRRRGILTAEGEEGRHGIDPRDSAAGIREHGKVLVRVGLRPGGEREFARLLGTREGPKEGGTPAGSATGAATPASHATATPPRPTPVPLPADDDDFAPRRPRIPLASEVARSSSEGGPAGPPVRSAEEGYQLWKETYDRALLPEMTPERISAAVDRLGSLSAADLVAVARRVGIMRGLPTKAKALEAIRERILFRKADYERAKV